MHKIKFRAFIILFGLIIWLLGGTAIGQPRVKIDVNCAGVKIGEVDISTYETSGNGVLIKACFNKTGGCPYTCCHKFRFFSIIYKDLNPPPQWHFAHNGQLLQTPYIDPPFGGYKEEPDFDKKPEYNEPGEGTATCPYPYYLEDEPQWKKSRQLQDQRFETWVVCLDETNKKICGLAHFRWGYTLDNAGVPTIQALDFTNRLTNADIKGALDRSGFIGWTFSADPKDCCPLSGEDAYDREDYHCNVATANDFHVTYYSDTKMELVSHHDGPFPNFTPTPSNGGITWDCTWSGATVTQCNWISVGAKFKQKLKNKLKKKSIYWTLNGNPIRTIMPGVGFDVTPPYGEGPVIYTLYNDTYTYLEVFNFEMGLRDVDTPLEEMDFASGELGEIRNDEIVLAPGSYWDTLIEPDHTPFYLLTRGDVVADSAESKFVQQHEHPASVETFYIRHDQSGYLPSHGNPTGTFWTELFPGFFDTWIITEWIDNDDGYLSECDNVLFTNTETSDTSWEHIERVMPTMTAINYIEPGTIFYFESITDNPMIDPIYEPVGTYWNEVYPGNCILYEIEYWEDNGNGYLDSCDYIGLHVLSGPDSCTIADYHVEGMATDIISDPIRFEECSGMCGDANGDEIVNVSDAVSVINYVFVGGDEPQPVLACGDANSDGMVNVSDAVYIINYVFVSGPLPEDCAPGSPDWYNGDCCPFE
jgi:hypothetical protein